MVGVIAGHKYVGRTRGSGIVCNVCVCVVSLDPLCKWQVEVSVYCASWISP